MKKKTFLWKLTALVTCLIMMVTAIRPVMAQAASGNALSLTYKGKTLKIYDGLADAGYDDIKEAAYADIKKAFGKPDKTALDDFGRTSYKYKAKGFSFEFMRYGDEDSLYNITIKITSKKAALNGIKVGMSYDKVLKKLEKNYGKSLVSTQKNKKKITLSILGELTVEYTFKDGKVSKIYFFCS